MHLSEKNNVITAVLFLSKSMMNIKEKKKVEYNTIFDAYIIDNH